MNCPHGCINCNSCNTSEAARELAVLRTRLQEVERERDEAVRSWTDLTDQLTAERAARERAEAELGMARGLLDKVAYLWRYGADGSLARCFAGSARTVHAAGLDRPEQPNRETAQMSASGATPRAGTKEPTR